MADFLLSVGVDVGLSYDQMQKDISNLVSRLNSNPPKIRVQLEIDNTAINNLRTQIEELNNLTRAANEAAASGGGSRGGSRGGRSAAPGSQILSAASGDTTAYYNALRQVDTLLTQVTSNHAKWTAASNGKSSEAYRNLGIYRDELASLKSQLQSGGMTAQEFRRRIAELRSGVASSSETIKSAGENTQTWSERLGKLSAKFGTWFSITRVIMAAYRAIRRMVTNVIELDTAMTELKKVTDETDASYERFLNRATSRAKELGAALTDTVNATADFARLGYGIEDAEKLADAAIVYKNVGDGIEDIGTASESIIATMQAFGVAPEKVMSIVDRFNEVGNNFAISSKGVGDALMRSAAALHSANNTIDESIALAAAANTIVQDPDKVGTALKTVSMYLRAAKTEAEEVGEATDGMASSISELRDDIFKLTGGSVDIQIDEDTFKSTYQILKELSQVWGDLTDVSQANILELVGGKRNSNIVSALLENFSIAEEAIQTSANSAGSALAENEKVLDSIQGKINIMKATFETFSQNFIGSDLVKGVVIFITHLLELLNWTSRVVSALGGLKTVLLTVAAVLLMTKVDFVISVITGLYNGLLKIVNIIPNAITAWRNFATSVAAANTTMQATIPVVGLILAAITAVVAGLSFYNAKLEENRQKMIENGREAGQLSENLDSLVEQYRKLGEDGDFDNSDREQALGIQQQINNLLGNEAHFIDLANGKYEHQLKLLRQIQYEKAKDKYVDITDAKDAAVNGLWHQIAIGTSTIGPGITADKDENEAIEKLLKGNGFERYFGNDHNRTTPASTFYIDTSSEEAIIQSYEDMIELRTLLKQTREEEIKEGGALHDFYNNLDKRIEGLSDSVEQYKSAIKDYDINQAVVHFNETDFGGVKGALIDTKEEMESWAKAMIESDDISDGIKENLIGLAKTYYPELSDAINESAQAHYKEKYAKAGSVSAIAGFIKNLDAEAAQCGLTKKAFIELIAQEIIFNNTKLSVSQQIDALEQLRIQAGITAAEVRNAIMFDSLKEAYAANTLGVERAYRNGLISKETRDKQKAEILASLNSSLYDGYKDTPPITSPYQPTDTDKKPSGGDNTPDYQDSTDATINRINLRSKELKQQEEEIEYYLELAEANKDLGKQMSLTNDVMAIRWERINAIKTANSELSSSIENVMATNPWDEASWFDSQGEATEAYYDLYNNSTKAEQEKIKPVFDILSKLINARIENTEELSDTYKLIFEDEERLGELAHKIFEENISGIEHNRDMTLNKDPFADTTSFYTALQEEYHKEAERLRALDPVQYKEEIQELEQQWWDAEQSKADWKWDNSQRWIEQRNALNDWELFGDSEIDAWERVVKWLKEEYPNDLEKIQEAEQNLFDARKEEFGKATDLASSYFDSKSTLLQSYFDVTNSIAEAQHEINKELEASKTMYEYLDEETRKLLFNQEDYNILSEELYDIQYKADKLQREYQRALSGATLDTIEEITSNYEMQYETLMKSYEIAKAELEVAKKRQQLDNVLNERNVRMFINGQWQWVANTQDVINAQGELADAQYEAEKARIQKSQTDSLNNLTAQQDHLGTVINQFESGVINLDYAINQVVKMFGDLPTAVYKSLTSARIYDTSKLETGQIYRGEWTQYSDGKYKTASNGMPIGQIYRGNWLEYEAHANGTRSTKAGNVLLGDGGSEMFIESNGHFIPINQLTFGNVKAGGIVFNQDQMDFTRKLWDLSNMGRLSNLGLINKPVQQVAGETNDNRIIINGMTVDNGSSDGQALISALRRYVGNH